MTYLCPTCGVGDPDCYITCNHPACPDGRDRCTACPAGRDPSYDCPVCHDSPKRPDGYPMPGLPLPLALLVVLVILITLAAVHAAFAMNHGFDPSAPAVKWFEKLERPDQRPNSCCGKADAYPVDRYQKNSDHTFTVWVADGSALKYPDGTTRDEWDTSVPIIVPDTKVNDESDDLDNPTEHGWLFFRPSTKRDVGTIYCFIRHPNGS